MNNTNDSDNEDPDIDLYDSPDVDLFDDGLDYYYNLEISFPITSISRENSRPNCLVKLSDFTWKYHPDCKEIRQERNTFVANGICYEYIDTEFKINGIDVLLKMMTEFKDNEFLRKNFFINVITSIRNYQFVNIYMSNYYKYFLTDADILERKHSYIKYPYKEKKIIRLLTKRV